jgi:hypothetical protein
VKIKEGQILQISFILAVVLLAADYVTGPYIQFPITFLIPVGLTAWYCGFTYGLGFAISMALIRFFFNLIWNVPWTIFEDLVNALIRIAVLSAFAYLMNRTARQTRELKERVQTLEGLLPICSSCKKIRNDKGEWERIENYISDHSKAEFTHGLCSECAHKLYPEVYKD